MSPHVTPPLEVSFSACPVGTACAASSIRRWSAARPVRVSKTTVKTPSGRSPKCRARIVLARSESVPGTANEFESSGVSRVAATAPTTTTASQQARTGARKRRTARVQRSGTGAAYDVGMRRLAATVAVSVAAVLAPAALASPTVRMTIVHVVQGCHVWGTNDSQALGPTRTITLARGSKLMIRVNCPMSFDFSQLSGPKLALGAARTYPGTARTIVFAHAGVYRLKAVNVESSEQMGMATLGPDNTLLLTVRVR